MDQRVAVVMWVAGICLLTRAAFADEAPAPKPKADPAPWAKVTLNAEIGGRPKKGEPHISGGIVAGPGVGSMTWLGPTPPGAKRLSDKAIQPDSFVSIIFLGLSKGLWLSVWMEPNAEYLALMREKYKVAEGEKDAKKLELARWDAIGSQRNALDRLADPFNEKVKEAARIIFEGEVAAPDRESPLPSILATGQLELAVRRAKTPLPGPGGAWVEGQLEVGKFDVGGGKTTPLAIRNGTSPIALIGKGVEDAGGLKGDVRAVGRLLIGSDRQLLLEVDEVKQLKK